MRLILGITLLLMGIGTLSCRVDVPASDRAIVPPAGQWVRAADGWERTETWQGTTFHGPGLHPLVVAAGQALVSIWGLVAFRRDDGDAAIGGRR